jgi:drug/metabolite transporter (DMT)-like permease
MVFKRKLADLDPRAAMGGSLVIAAVALAPLAAVDPPTEAPPLEAIVALVVLGLFCTAAAFVFFGVLIAEVGPGRGLVITYIAPVVAVALGVTVLGERPGAGAVAGLLLILAGSWLSTDGRLPPGLAAVVTRRRERRGTHGTEPVERRSRAMNAPSSWTRYWTTAAGLRSSFASVPWRR